MTTNQVFCRKCGQALSEGRLKMMPGTTICAPCLSSMGDVEIPVGIMIFDHKTAPSVFITNRNHLRNIVRADRRGFKRAGG